MSNFLQHFAFADPGWLFLLLALPPLLLLRRRTGNPSGIGFSSLTVLATLGQVPRERPGGLSQWLLAALLVAAILGLARPQWRNHYVARTASGIDILIALDVSGSMDTRDFYPNDDRRQRPIRRFDAAKGVIEDFVGQRPDDRIGMVVFGTRPYSLAPLTLNHEWVTDSLRKFRLRDIDSAGTAVGSAIAAAATRLTKREAKGKIMVLVTDGASNSGRLDPVQAAELAASLGIRVYTIAIGTEEGRLSPSQVRNPKQEFDVTSLREIARLTGAEFFHARSTRGLRETFDSINQIEKTEARHHTVVDAHDLYPWFVGAAFLAGFVVLSIRCLNPPPTP